MTPEEIAEMSEDCQCSCKQLVHVTNALQDLLAHYVELVHSGDAGHWDPETEEVVIEARAALKDVFK